MTISETLILMSAKSALLTNVKPNLRAVCVDVRPHTIELHFYFHGPVSEDDEEDVEMVITEIMADMPIKDDDGYEIIYKYRTHQIDAPSPLECIGSWVYYRYE
jgi:hypothetical protein